MGKSVGSTELAFAAALVVQLKSDSSKEAVVSRTSSGMDCQVFPKDAGAGTTFEASGTEVTARGSSC